jgi:hypothetical protein
MAKITRRAEEFKDLHEALQRNLQTYLTLTMDALAGIHYRVKNSVVADATRQMVRSFSSFDNPMRPILTVNSFPKPDAGCGEDKVALVDGVRWYPQVPNVA